MNNKNNNNNKPTIRRSPNGAIIVDTPNSNIKPKDYHTELMLEDAFDYENCDYDYMGGDDYDDE